MYIVPLLFVSASRQNPNGVGSDSGTGFFRIFVFPIRKNQAWIGQMLVFKGNCRPATKIIDQQLAL